MPVARNAFKSSQKSLVSEGWRIAEFLVENRSESDLVAGGATPPDAKGMVLGQAAARQLPPSPDVESRWLRLVKERRGGASGRRCR
jgi:hypothetical protein